jgi:hypothetical protein
MYLSVVIQITAFILATVALFLNINANVGLSTAQEIQLTVASNILNHIPSSYNLTNDNVTISEDNLRILEQCTVYVEEHIPIVPPFNTTIVVNLTAAQAGLDALLASMEGRGTIVVEQVGTVAISETGNTSVPYSKEHIVFANSNMHYIGIEPTITMMIEQNGTTGLSFGGWNPPIDIINGNEYNAIYDLNQLDIQTALPVMRVQKKSYPQGTTLIVVDESETAVNAGDVVAVTRKLQL